MSGTGGAGAANADLAGHLETHRESLLTEYRRRLREADSPLAQDPAALRQCLAEADQVLADVMDSLRESRLVVGIGGAELTRDIGVARAASRVHPNESLRAASTLFEVVLAEVKAFTIRRAAGRPDDLEVLAGPLALAGEALHTSILWRIREAAVSYVSFLLRKIHEAHVDERRRVAREIHDRLGHGIATAYTQLQLSETYWSSEPVRAFEKLSLGQQSLRETLDEIRALLTDTRLAEPLESLEKALKAYVETAPSPDCDIRVTVNGDEAWVPPQIRDEVFIMVREAIRNSLTHAAPRAVVVGVDIAPHALSATVHDDGTGFDPAAEVDRQRIGITSMRERAALLGGSLLVSSALARGTRTEIVIPLPGNLHDQ